MERRERYDPEDIESLLSERSFDELLDAERAFVLRHLSGRDEYERMRALLHHVRPDEHLRGTIEADDRVRQNVMEAFRAQQRPQWRIWLNSLASWSMPQPSSGYWRPALAFGTLALLIVAGVVAVRQFSDGSEHSELAEVKQVTDLPKEDPPPASAKEERKNEDSLVDQPQAALASEMASAEVAVGEDRMEQEATLDMEATSELAEDPQASAPPVAEKEIEDLAAGSVQYDATVTLTPASTTATGVIPATGHVVTSDELAKNLSVANVSEVAKDSGSRKRAAAVEKALVKNSASRSMAQDPALLGLLSAGW